MISLGLETAIFRLGTQRTLTFLSLLGGVQIISYFLFIFISVHRITDVIEKKRLKVQECALLYSLTLRKPLIEYGIVDCYIN
jgi:hypothetical protein